MKKVLLIIMDGVGVAPRHKGNAVALANPKNLSQYWNISPHTYLLASGKPVGLPDGIKGNSEVGHMNIGSGRAINQNLPRINTSIDKGYFFTNSVLIKALNHAQKNKSKFHIIGCLSDGSVHSHIDHFKAILKFLAKNNFTNEVYIHAFTDGRDTPPNEAPKFFEELGSSMSNLGVGRFGTIIGRYFAMDRNNTWERTKQAYDLLTNGEGQQFDNWRQALDFWYTNGKSDEFIPASVIKNEGRSSNISENDVVINLNFRADRAIQITETFIDKNFSAFPIMKFNNLFYAGIVEYSKDFPKNVLFAKEYITSPLGKVISESGGRQLRIAESEKFPHVTYFFNGGTSIKFQGEDRIEVQSPKVATYDMKPEMSTPQLVEKIKQIISSDTYDLIVLNLANGDMVGHTGNIDASIKSVSTVDWAVDEVTKRFVALGGTVLITADHGNVEELINLKTGEIDTEHSINPVPFMIVEKETNSKTLPYGTLKDIAPTILSIMEIPIPSEMTGRSLLSPQ
ncbi:2,3-bisphosphoglycerate-independent phosphoglycerate mutase [Candidatus Dojkabacteria bacterium]|jgi:2,3-bisphosphoglycerate-independent phosphoglycerate mutase|nr:2,3-bisphosphoglycerate-independent phosphoglycerate mutase [Candidatus Dojkabacteria bacterium]